MIELVIDERRRSLSRGGGNVMSGKERPAGDLLIARATSVIGTENYRVALATLLTE